MTSPLTAATNLFTDDFPGSALRTTLWVPLANGANYKGQTWTSSSHRSLYDDRRRLSDGEQQYGSFCAADLGGEKQPKDHAFLGTEAITIDAWNPMAGGLSFEGKFKFSGDGTGNQAALNQGGMILGFFSYEKNPPCQGTITPRSTSRSSPATSKTPL